ncbi:unnamed protein product, partial [Polarella glacialis]
AHMALLAAAAAGGLATLLMSRALQAQEPAESVSLPVNRFVPDRLEPTVIVVPGGGLTLEGLPHPWVRRRLQEAAKLYAERKHDGKGTYVVTLSGGTPHKPMPVDPVSGFQVTEAEATARSLIREFGVAAEDVFEEGWSLDTVANAYLLRAIHTDVAGWRTLIVVNNAFHMPRTRAIFEKVFSLQPLPEAGEYSVSFVEVPDEGLEPEVLAARTAREAQSLAGWTKTSANITTMKQMQVFLFSDHMAYASKRLVKDREPVSPEALKSY